MTPEEIIHKIGQDNRLIEFATTPARAFMIVSHLQLALRHPDNIGESAELMQEVIRHLADAIAEVTDTPEVLTLIAMGDHQEFDMTNEEFDASWTTMQIPPPDEMA